MITRALSYAVRLLQLKADPISFARRIGVRVGEGCDFINLSLDTFGSEPYLISIGHDVTLSGPIRFLTHDGGVRVFARDHPDIDVVAPIVIEDDVFIGVNAVILPGVTIHAAAVVGAGAVVTRDVPRGCVVAGNPARVIRDRSAYLATALAKNVGTRRLSLSAKRTVLTQRLGAPERP